MANTDRELATAAQVADYLQISEAALAQNRYRGVGPKFIRHGRRIFYRWSDVQAYLDAATVSHD